MHAAKLKVSDQAPLVRTSVVKSKTKNIPSVVLNPGRLVLSGKLLSEAGEPIIGAKVITNEKVVTQI